MLFTQLHVIVGVLLTLGSDGNVWAYKTIKLLVLNFLARYKNLGKNNDRIKHEPKPLPI
jgi:hypothetical protein